MSKNWGRLVIRIEMNVSYLDMIRAKDNTQSNLQAKGSTLDIPMEARIAISQGVTSGDAVAELEYLGLTVRTINILEASKFQITSLQQLVSHRQQDLLEIPNFGIHGLRELMACLARYHELGAAKKHMDLDFRRGIFNDFTSD